MQVLEHPLCEDVADYTKRCPFNGVVFHGLKHCVRKHFIKTIVFYRKRIVSSRIKDFRPTHCMIYSLLYTLFRSICPSMVKVEIPANTRVRTHKSHRNIKNNSMMNTVNDFSHVLFFWLLLAIQIFGHSIPLISALQNMRMSNRRCQHK